MSPGWPAAETEGPGCQHFWAQICSHETGAGAGNITFGNCELNTFYSEFLLSFFASSFGYVFSYHCSQILLLLVVIVVLLSLEETARDRRLGMTWLRVYAPQGDTNATEDSFKLLDLQVTKPKLVYDE